MGELEVDMSTGRSGDPRHTPIPTDLLGLTKAVTRIEAGVETIRVDLLPPVAQAASEARDGVIKLDGWTKDLTRRIKVLETTPPPTPSHECHQDERLDGHDRAISGQEKELAGLTKWRTWLAAILIPLTLTAAGSGAKAINDAATVRTRVDVNTETITKLSEARERDRDAIIREVKAVPAKVQAVAATDREDREDQEAADPSITDVKAKMTDRQRRRLDQLLLEAGIDDGG